MSEVKNVTITVPVGLNGWQQTGSVVINGMKVEFPVGEETQVPETAAALLNELIEAAEKRAEDTAKPNNHYVGAVTIPAGKNLTLEEGAGIKRADKVILPETVLEERSDDDNFDLHTPWAENIETGKTYNVNYNGTTYACTAIYNETAGLASNLLGSTDAFGIEGGNPDAPFTMMCFPNEMQAEDWPMVGILNSLDGATSVTLSVVEKGKAVSVGGVRVIKMTVASMDESTGEIYLNTPVGYNDIKNLIAMGVMPTVNVGMGEESYYLSLIKDSTIIIFGAYVDGVSLMLSVAETSNNGVTGTVCVLRTSGA